MSRFKLETGLGHAGGEVDEQHRSCRPRNQIRRLAGVVGLSDLITVRPHVSIGNVEERIAQAYRRDAEIEAVGINISVDGGRVTAIWHVSKPSARLDG